MSDSLATCPTSFQLIELPGLRGVQNVGICVHATIHNLGVFSDNNRYDWFIFNYDLLVST